MTTAHTDHKKVGLTNLETAEKRRRIAEIAWQRAQLQHESATLKQELADDKKAFPR